MSRWGLLWCGWLLFGSCYLKAGAECLLLQGRALRGKEGLHPGQGHGQAAQGHSLHQTAGTEKGTEHRAHTSAQQQRRGMEEVGGSQPKETGWQTIFAEMLPHSAEPRKEVPSNTRLSPCSRHLVGSSSPWPFSGYPGEKSRRGCARTFSTKRGEARAWVQALALLELPRQDWTTHFIFCNFRFLSCKMKGSKFL